MVDDNPWPDSERRITQACREVLVALACPHDDRVLSELSLYLRETRRWGSRIDLTAARSFQEFVDLSLADAAVLARVELERGGGGDRIVDVGTGGGAPGIPLLSILSGPRGEVPGRLVEPRTKRVAFLRSVVGQLQLPQVEVVRARSSVLVDKSCDVALARATLPPADWLVEGGRLAQRAVWVLLAREEPPSAPGWVIDKDIEYQWPLTSAERRAVRYIPSGFGESIPD